MREVLIDITRLVGRLLEGRLPTGIDRVSLAYVAHFQARSQAVVRYRGRWLVLDRKATQHIFAELLDPSEKFGWLIRWYIGYSYALDWGRRDTPFRLLNICHGGLNDKTYAAEVTRRHLQAVFFLHDLIPISYPEYGRSGEADRHRRRVETMLSVGRGVIVNSTDTRNALEDFARGEGLVVPPCVVAPLAPAPFPLPTLGRPLAKPYFVTLGTIEPRKNHLLLLHVWRQLVQELGEAAPSLVVIGQRGWECEQVVDLLDRCDALRGHVIERPRCDDVELATWLFHARALLFPSFAEGFGIPMIEALTLGLPVIASNLAVFREVAGDVPEYVDPLDGPGWKRMILGYMVEDGVLYRQQRERMKGFAAPTWENHFQLVDGFLEELDAI